MKKAILIVLLFASLGLSQTIFKPIMFYADSVSQTLDVGRGASLVGLLVPGARTDTVRFWVSYTGETWYKLMESDSLYYILPNGDSSAITFIDKPPVVWNWVKVEIDTAVTDTFAILGLIKGLR
jgi:hypothetical protein